MLVSERSDYCEEFPETFDFWPAVDSVIVSDVVSDIIDQVLLDLNTRDRNLVAGLRLALNIIARNTKI